MSEKYAKYLNIFSVKKASRLLSHKHINHAINIKNAQSLYDSFYNFLITELQVLRDYINDDLIKN